MGNWLLDSPLAGAALRRCAVVLMLLTVFISTAGADYAVQAGAFGLPANAERAMRAIREVGFPVYSEQRNRASGGVLTLILVGPFPTREEASKARARLGAQGIKGYVRTVPAQSKALPPPATTAQPAVPLPAMSVQPPDDEEMSPPSPAVEAAPGETPSPPPAAEDWLADRVLEPAPSPVVTGFFQSELAYKWPEPDHYSVFRHTLALRGKGSWGARLRWHLGGRLSYDAAFDLTDVYPRQVEQDQRLEARPWETYLDVSAGNWDLRLGRQHIIWGEMVGLFFADVVSAKDLRQFILPEFDMIRIPQWALRGEYFRGDFHGELIWIPYPTYDQVGVPGADFYPGPVPPPPGYVQVFQGERRPAGGLDQSGYGLRLSILRNGWDMAGFYYSSMDAEPSFFRRVTTVGATPALVYGPDHKRIEQLGATLSKDLAPVVLRGEMVYTHDRYFEVTRLSDTDGVVRQDYLDYAVGLDYADLMQSRLNLQFFQRWFPDHDRDMVSKSLESGLTLFVSTHLAQGAVEPQLLLMTGLNRGDWLARPRVVWQGGDHWRVTGGVDVFGGPRLGLFGRYNSQDRVYAELRYSF